MATAPTQTDGGKPDTATSAGIDWANRHAIDMARIEAGQVANVQALLKGLEAKLAGILVEWDLKPGQAAKLATIQKAAGEAIGKTYGTIATQQADALTAVAKMESAATGQALNAQIGVDAFGPVLTEKQWSKVANQALIFGHSSGDWWKSQDDSLRFKFMGQMQEGYALGESVDDLIRRVRGTKAKGYSDGVMSASRREAEALVRSSVQTVSNAARLAGFEATPEVVKGIRWTATLDGRTTPICQALQGLAWRLPDYEPIGHAKAFPGPTAHWNCRSTQVAVLRTWDELSGKKIAALDNDTLQARVEKRLAEKGMDPDQIAKAKVRARASMDGQVGQAMDYQAWLKGKGDAYALDLLGPGRFAMWKAGSITMRDLTDQNNRPLTIAQLQAAIDAGGFAVETEGAEYLPPAEPTPKYPVEAIPAAVTMDAPEPPFTVTQVTLKEDKAKLAAEFLAQQGIDLSKLEDDDPVSGDDRITEMHNALTDAGNVAALRDSTGKIVAAVSWGQYPSGDVPIYNLGSIAPGGGSQAMLLPFQDAVNKGKGVFLQSLNKASDAFHTKWGLTKKKDPLPHEATDFTATPEKAVEILASLKAYQAAKQGDAPTAQKPFTPAGADAWPSTNPTKAQAYAIKQYSGQAFDINLALRSGDPTWPEWEFNAPMGSITGATLVKDLDAYFDNTPATPVDLLVHRAVKFTKEQSDALLQQGGMFKDAGYMSTTHDPATLGKTQGPESWRFEIQIPQGSTHVARIDDIAQAGKGESEVLIGRDSAFEVLAVDHATRKATLRYLGKQAQIPAQESPATIGTTTVPKAATDPAATQAAALKIAGILADPKGQTLKAAALVKLQKEQPGLPPVEMLAMAEGIAAEKQAAASKASVLSQAKKKLVAGETPTPAQFKLLNDLPVEEQNAFLASVEDAKKAAGATLYPEVEQAITAAAGKPLDAATMAKLAKLPQDEQDYLKGKHKEAEIALKVEAFKTGDDYEALWGTPEFEALPDMAKIQIGNHLIAKKAKAEAQAKVDDWKQSSDPLKVAAANDAIAVAPKNAAGEIDWTSVGDNAEIFLAGKKTEALANGVAGPQATKLKQAAFLKATGKKPQDIGDAGDVYLWINSNYSPEGMIALADTVQAEAAAKQAAASLASKLSTAKAKMVEGKQPSPSEQAAIDGLTPEAFQAFASGVTEAKIAKAATQSGKVTVVAAPTVQAPPPKVAAVATQGFTLEPKKPNSHTIAKNQGAHPEVVELLKGPMDAWLAFDEFGFIVGATETSTSGDVTTLWAFAGATDQAKAAAMKAAMVAAQQQGKSIKIEAADFDLPFLKQLDTAYDEMFAEAGTVNLLPAGEKAILKGLDQIIGSQATPTTTTTKSGKPVPPEWQNVPVNLLEHGKWKPTAIKGIKEAHQVDTVDAVLPFLGTYDQDNALLQAWGTGAFSEINAANPTPAAKQVGKAFVGLIDALPDHPAPPEIYRALGFHTPADAKAFLASLGKPGSVYTQEKPITAWTAENPLAKGATPMNNIALDLAASFGDETVILHVKTATGAKDISYLYGTDTTPGGELLYTQGTKFKIETITKQKDGKTVVVMSPITTAAVAAPSAKPAAPPTNLPTWATAKPKNQSEAEAAIVQIINTVDEPTKAKIAKDLGLEDGIDDVAQLNDEGFVAATVSMYVDMIDDEDAAIDVVGLLQKDHKQAIAAGLAKPQAMPAVPKAAKPPSNPATATVGKAPTGTAKSLADFQQANAKNTKQVSKTVTAEAFKNASDEGKMQIWEEFGLDPEDFDPDDVYSPDYFAEFTANWENGETKSEWAQIAAKAQHIAQESTATTGPTPASPKAATGPIKTLAEYHKQVENYSNSQHIKAVMDAFKAADTATQQDILTVAFGLEDVTDAAGLKAYLEDIIGDFDAEDKAGWTAQTLYLKAKADAQGPIMPATPKAAVKPPVPPKTIDEFNQEFKNHTIPESGKVAEKAFAEAGKETKLAILEEAFGMDIDAVTDAQLADPAWFQKIVFDTLAGGNKTDAQATAAYAAWLKHEEDYAKDQAAQPTITPASPTATKPKPQITLAEFQKTNKANTIPLSIDVAKQAFETASDATKIEIWKSLDFDPDGFNPDDALSPDFFGGFIKSTMQGETKAKAAKMAAKVQHLAYYDAGTAPPPAPLAPKAKGLPATSTSPDIKAKNLDLAVPDPSTLQTIKHLPGSTHPVQAQDPVTGKQWVVKAPDQGGGGEGHLQNEATADAMYRIMGAPVPGSAFLVSGGKPYKVAEFLEGAVTLKNWEATATTAEREAVYAKLQEHFVMDALLGNWDVAGQTNDNIMVMPDGTPVRVDNGGALDWRAMGNKKTAAEWSPTVDELTTLRDPSKAAGKTAQIFAGITQAEIHAQIAAIAAKQDDLVAELQKTKPKEVVEVFKKRIAYLEKQLPAGMRKATKAAKQAAQQTVGGLPPNIEHLVTKARLNGTAIKLGTSHIEDMTAVAWVERNVNGDPVTVTHLKVTDEGSKAIEKIIATQLQGAATAASAAPTTVQTAGKLDDPYEMAFISMAKTLHTHAADKQFNPGTVSTFAVALSDIDTELTTLAAIPHKTAVQKAKQAQLQHYAALGKQLNDAHDNGAAIPFVSGSKPDIGTFKDDPKAAAAAKAAKAAADAAEAARLAAIPKGSFTVTKSDKWATWINTFDNGYGTNTTAVQAFPVEAGVYTLEFPDGTVATYIPRTGRWGAGGNRHAGLAFEGTVQIRKIGDPTHAAMADTIELLRKIGLDTTPPDPDYEELLWLRKTAYLHNDHAAFDKAIKTAATPAEKITAGRAFIKTQYGKEPPARGSKDYTAGGVTNSFGDGYRYTYRADITRAEIEQQMALYTLQQSPWNSTLESMIEGMLSNGGEATSTTGRVRKGVPVRGTGGSPESDMYSGGADFMMTRIRKKTDQDKPSIGYKIGNLARADAVSYTGDQYGETGNRTVRRSTVQAYKDIAAKQTSDESIFKNGLFLLDEIDVIRTRDAAQRKDILAIFKRHKITHLTDGRKIEDVVK